MCVHVCEGAADITSLYPVVVAWWVGEGGRQRTLSICVCWLRCGGWVRGGEGGSGHYLLVSGGGGVDGRCLFMSGT